MKTEIWFRISFGEIKKVKVIRETKDFVYIKGGIRESKLSCYRSYFKTFSGAKIFLLNKKETKLKDAERILEEARRKLQKVRDIQEKDIDLGE